MNARTSTRIALLRGINVGGRNRLPMEELVGLLESLGLEEVETYIQSGNVVFRAPRELPAALEEEIAGRIEESRGFRPRVLLLGADELGRAMDANPFPEGEAEPSRLHLYFLASTPEEPRLDRLAEVRSPSERFHLGDRVFYLHAPDGIGRSKLAAGVERHLRVAATARNWRTLARLRRMAEAEPG